MRLLTLGQERFARHNQAQVPVPSAPDYSGMEGGMGTVSAWQARGAVPNRYRALTSGDRHQTIMTPPRGWGECEEYAFTLALFRFNRLGASVAQSGSSSDIISTFGRPQGFWPLLRRCQQDLASVMEHRADHLHLAFELLLQDDITASEAAIERGRDYLQWRKSVG